MTPAPVVSRTVPRTVCGGTLLLGTSYQAGVPDWSVILSVTQALTLTQRNMQPGGEKILTRICEIYEGILTVVIFEI